MILIGQYDSPFVRRVGIALTLYGMPFEHRPWSVFADAGRITALNPLCRVPTLVLDGGTVLTDSHMMLDHLDARVTEPLFPRAEPDRHRALRVATLACGMAEKAVSLFYEHRLHRDVSEVWVARCRSQIASVAAALEAERCAAATPFWFGGTAGHADIATACAWRFVQDAHPGLIAEASHPALAAHSATLEAMKVFQRVRQPFQPPA